MRTLRFIPLILLALGLTVVCDKAHAQGGVDGKGAEAARQKQRDYEAFDLNGDGIISDYEVETVLRWRLMNPELKLTKKEKKALAKKAEEERKAEIKKYDLNGDGKLDDHENKLRLADQEKQRKAQKKSKESQELTKPMIEYLGGK